MGKTKKKQEKERAKKIEEGKKKVETARKEAAKKKAAAEGKEVEEEKEEEKKDEAPEAAESEEEAEPEEPEQPDEDPPKVELTAEEKAVKFVKAALPDLNSFQYSTSFAKFSIPQKEEGFDDVKFSWADKSKSQEYLKSWIMERKTSVRIEDLKPSDWFKQKRSEWEKAVKGWSDKLGEYKKAVAQREAKKKAKAAAAAAKEKAEAAKAAAAA